MNDLVSAGIVSLGDETLMDINRNTPQSLASHRVELLHAMASVDSLFDLDLAGEHDIMNDAIQPHLQ